MLVLVVNLVVMVLVVANVVDNTTPMVLVVDSMVTIPAIPSLVVVVVVPGPSSSRCRRPRCTIMVVVQVRCPREETVHALPAVEWDTGPSNVLIIHSTKWKWWMMVVPCSSRCSPSNLIPYRY